MNTDNNELQMPEWARLGTELLEGSIVDLSSVRLLQTPGVDPALYMLFGSLSPGHMCISNHQPIGMWSVAEVRNLMQCAFMLGAYVRKSIEEVEKLW